MSGGSPKKKERNHDIVRRRIQGEKIEVVALLHGITPGRVSQIVKREKSHDH